VSKICVTGGAGFIGSHIVDMFLGQGHEVFVIDDLSTGLKENLSSKAVFFESDICSAEAAEIIAEQQPEIIVHTAAQMSVRVSMDNPMLDSQINVLGMANLLSAAAKLPISPRIVFLSTGGAIYGEQELFPAPESHTILPTSLYGVNKFVGERYLDFWHRSYGVSYAALRLGNVYGPRQNPHGEAGVVAIFYQHLLENKVPTIFGSGEQTRDFVFVADVVEAVRLASKSDLCGSFNVGTGVETSVNLLFETICCTLDRQLTPGYAEARAGEQLRSSIDPAAIKQALGWEPAHSLQEGLDQTASWFRLKGKPVK